MSVNIETLIPLLSLEDMLNLLSIVDKYPGFKLTRTINRLSIQPTIELNEVMITSERLRYLIYGYLINDESFKYLLRVALKTEKDDIKSVLPGKLEELTDPVLLGNLNGLTDPVLLEQYEISKYDLIQMYNIQKKKEANPLLYVAIIGFIFGLILLISIPTLFISWIVGIIFFRKKGIKRATFWPYYVLERLIEG